MARPLKSGIDYFPLDVNFFSDIKTRKILKACGPQSVVVLINLLCTIYKDEGYYMTWDEDVGFLTADEIGVKESLVHEVIKKAIGVDFFDQSLFKKYKILTSLGIQKRYLGATARRKSNPIKDEFNLVNVTNNIVNDSNNSINDSKSTQRKEKERKEKERERKVNKYMPIFTKLLDSKPSEKSLSSLSQSNLEKLISEVEQSTWLRSNLNLDTCSQDFMDKILQGKYRDYAKPESKNKFHNFEATSSDLSPQELEDLARRKVEAYGGDK